jgi:hypothetical protein
MIASVFLTDGAPSAIHLLPRQLTGGAPPVIRLLPSQLTGGGAACSSGHHAHRARPAPPASAGNLQANRASTVCCYLLLSAANQQQNELPILTVRQRLHNLISTLPVLEQNRHKRQANFDLQ